MLPDPFDVALAAVLVVLVVLSGDETVGVALVVAGVVAAGVVMAGVVAAGVVVVMVALDVFS